MKFIPHGYQRYAVERIISTPRLALFQQMGLGKTVEALTAINDLRYNRWAVSRVLVIAPKTVAEATWQAEAQSWDHLRHLRINTVLGTARQRIRALYAPGDVWVVNRENVPWLVDYYKQAWPFDMVVIDESSSFKNPRAQRFKKLKLVLGRISRILLLTGTPAPNGLEDLWAQIYLLDEGQRLGKTMTAYREMFFTQDRSYPGQPYRTYSPQQGADQWIQSAISDICVSMKAEDYLTLPEYIEDVIPVKLDPAARKAYDKMERDMLLEVDTETITAGTAAVLSNKLLQLGNGAVYDNDHHVQTIHGCKLEAFLETVERLQGEHVLVFYSFQHDRDRILDALGGSGLRVRAYTGAADETAWNGGEIDVLLAHPASCAYGLNLQRGGHHAIWFGLTWSLEQYQQANKRLHRQGQKCPVVVHHLVVQDSRDVDVMGALRSKGDTQDLLMQSLKARIEKVRDGI